MNGVSLLIALATLGVDVRWESGPNNDPVYTIRIESVVHQRLRDGEAVVSTVEPEDQTIRRFRIAMGPKPRVESRPALTANEVQYGWRPSPDDPGKIDYFVQVLPERLETLAKGIPIECEVHPDVPEVHFIYFFQGSADLPRKLPVGLQAPPPQNPPARGPDEAVRPAANSVAQPSNNSTYASPAAESPRYTGNSAATRTGTTRTGLSDGSRSSTQRSYEDDRAWRNEAGSKSSSTYGPPEPPPIYRSQQEPQAERYNQFREDMIRVPDSPQRPAYRGYADDPYRYTGRMETARQPAAAMSPPGYRPEPHQSAPAQGAPAGSDEATKQLVALLKEKELELKEREEALTKKGLATNFGTGAALTPTPTPEPAKASDEGLRTLNVITMLALFASLCANGYVGWLAWSYFWRFRNAASDLARAQTAASARAAA